MQTYTNGCGAVRKQVFSSPTWLGSGCCCSCCLGSPNPSSITLRRGPTTAVENHNYIHPGTRGECFDCGKKQVLLHRTHTHRRSNQQQCPVWQRPPFNNWEGGSCRSVPLLFEDRGRRRVHVSRLLLTTYSDVAECSIPLSQVQVQSCDGTWVDTFGRGYFEPPCLAGTSITPKSFPFSGRFGYLQSNSTHCSHCIRSESFRQTGIVTSSTNNCDGILMSTSLGAMTSSTSIQAFLPLWHVIDLTHPTIGNRSLYAKQKTTCWFHYSKPAAHFFNQDQIIRHFLRMRFSK